MRRSAQDGAGLRPEGQEVSFEGGFVHADEGKGGKVNIRDEGEIQHFLAVRRIVEHADNGAVPFAEETAGLGIREGERRIASAGNLRIGFAQGDELAVMLQKGCTHGFQIFHGIRRLAVIGTARGILHGVPVAPEHGQAAVGIRVFAAPGTAQADFLTVIDERGTGGKEIEIGRDLHPAV